MVKFLFLESFYGGSHRDFADGLIAHSRYPIDLVTLPARFWKWRMRGAALYFYQKIDSFRKYDGLITSDLMSLSDLKALFGGHLPPALIYFHENQLSYPLAPGEMMDYQFGFTDITSALAADQIVFNSNTHYQAFFSHLPKFINMMPEFRPKWVIREIREKSQVIYPGCHFASDFISSDRNPQKPPLIIWNHRWEFDKRPEAFFHALEFLTGKGIDFRVAILGERYQRIPVEFSKAKEKLGDRMVQFGYVDSRSDYYQWLSRGDIVISTADQENFGISVVEAIRHGCLPLVPNRLSFPEIIPELFHRTFLYEDQSDFFEKLYSMVLHPEKYISSRKNLSEAMGNFAWEKQIVFFDQLLQQLADSFIG
jgi:glycosyltransferase involved in cell wall biosynthesis